MKRYYQGSLRKTLFVVKEFAVIHIRALDLSGGTLRDRADIGSKRFRVASGDMEALQPFAERSDNRACHGFTRRPGNAMRFRLLDLESVILRVFLTRIILPFQAAMTDRRDET